ncbi:MAG: tellurite resistance TerB family protein [Pseudomonadota bacterium]
MFDAKGMLDALMRGAAPKQDAGGSADPQNQEGLGALLGQLTGGQGGGEQGAGGGLDLDALAQQFGVGSSGSDGGGSEQSGGLGGLLSQLQGQSGEAGQGGQAGGSILDTLSNVLGQATDGVREGAGQIGQSTGLDKALEGVTGGQSGGDLMAQLKELIANNQLGAGAALGGLGALVLGTQTGRSLAGSAVKLGAVALIGGLAYKAYQNYQDGKPLINDGSVEPEAAPEGSGFEAEQVSNEQAARYVRAMIAAATADGHMDPDEQQRIVGSLADTGLDREAEEFLARELNAPASINDIAAGVTSQEDALRTYTAARVAIDPDTAEEQSFLRELASRLGIEEGLANHIDMTARSAAA